MTRYYIWKTVKISTKNFKLINEFSKFVGYKINIKISVVFLCISNKPSEREIKKPISFIITLKIITYFGIHLN